MKAAPEYCWHCKCKTPTHFQRKAGVILLVCSVCGNSLDMEFDDDDEERTDDKPNA